MTADLSQRQTLQQEYFRGVAAVISAAATIVAPREGDTPDRQKYKQVSQGQPTQVCAAPQSSIWTLRKLLLTGMKFCGR